MNIIFKPECKTEIIEPTYDLPIIGEPISKTGASANNSNAYGVIVGIIGDGSSRRVRVMTEGYIDYDKVKENYMEYTDEAINALTGITLCSGGKLPTGVQPDWNQSDETQPDYIKNKVGYREIFTKQTGVCTTENIEPNTLYLVQDLSMEDKDTLAYIRSNMRYSNDGNRFCTIVPQLYFWIYMPYSGHETRLPTNFNKNNFTQYDTSDEYNYYLSDENYTFYIILDRTKLSSQNAETFPKDGIYFKTTNANTNRVSTAIYEYYRIDTLYLSSSVATTEELNTKQDTLIQSGASVGQVAKVTAVDKSGKPTAWEAVDMPNAIANGDKEIILTSSTADSTKKFKITVDDSGKLTATEVTGSVSI